MAMNVVIDMLKYEDGARRVNNKKGRGRFIAGFTMAEMLIVIAIIGVLAAVSFIAVQAHQKSMTQLQYDAIAKEIFVAAQNHLTLAKSENYQDTATLTHSKGTAGQAAADQTGTTGGTAAYNNDIFYFTNSDFTADGSSILDQMLPFGSVELVTGGSFIIRYQPKAARVLDVFYWTDGSDRYDANLSGTDYATLVGSADSASDRHKNYAGNAIVGWFGGEKVIDSGDYLHAPEIEVINAEMLLVKVTDTNTDAMLKQKTVPLLKLIVSGTQSEAKVVIPLISDSSGYISNGDRVEYDNMKSTYTVVLDSITAKGLHFSQLPNGTKTPAGTQINGKVFIPGENINIQAVAYSNTVLTSVAYSGEWTTNSLFGEVTEVTTGTGATATKSAEQVNISNIRHLENLNDDISDLDYDNSYFGNVISAVQTVDLDWSVFKTGVNIRKNVTGNPAINIYDKIGGATKADCFLPVSASYTLTYNGQSEVVIPVTTGEGDSAVTTEDTIIENHSIKGVVVDNTGEGEDAGTATIAQGGGGVFGELTGATINNLELIDTSVTIASGDAGALAGKLSNTTVTNVIAINSTNATDINVTSDTGAVGGLIGSTTNCTIQKSAAALIVSATGGNAGGLIGTTSDGTVTGCYSGGHTIDDSRGTGAVVYDSDSGDYNVTATASGTTGGVAGGLIGDAGSTEISYCYSTCSAEGVKVGGLVGNTSGSIDHCYSTGLVSGTGTNPVCAAFAVVDNSSSASITNSKYFEIINELATIQRGSPATTMTVQMQKVVDGDTLESIQYMEPVKKSDGTVVPLSSEISAIDESASSYNDFCASNWMEVKQWYNETLKSYYAGKYNLQTVAQIDDNANHSNKVVGVVEQETTTNGVTTPADFVATHYGDWPAPEIFVVNTATP